MGSESKTTDVIPPAPQASEAEREAFEMGRKVERAYCNKIVQDFYRVFQQSPPTIDIAEHSLKVEAKNDG